MARRNLLITYDLYKAGQDYKSLFDKIESLGKSKKILQSVWVLNTTYKAGEVRDYLQTVTDKNDFLFICEFDNWSSFMSTEANEFINSLIVN